MTFEHYKIDFGYQQCDFRYQKQNMDTNKQFGISIFILRNHKINHLTFLDINKLNYGYALFKNQFWTS